MKAPQGPKEEKEEGEERGEGAWGVPRGARGAAAFPLPAHAAPPVPQAPVLTRSALRGGPQEVGGPVQQRQRRGQGAAQLCRMWSRLLCRG